MLFESNRDNEDNNDCTSISSKESIDSRKVRQGCLVKEIIEKSNAVCISLDLEHGGDKCGVTQLSAVLFRLGEVHQLRKNQEKSMIYLFTNYQIKPWIQLCEVGQDAPQHQLEVRKGGKESYKSLLGRIGNK